MDYWARRGLHSEQTKSSLVKLVDQIADAKIESDSFMIELQKRNLNLATSFTELQTEYDLLDDKYKDLASTNNKLNGRVQVYENENGNLRKSRNTAWWVAGGAGVLSGILTGLLISK